MPFSSVSRSPRFRVALSLLAGLAACGGSDEPGGSTQPGTSVASVSLSASGTGPIASLGETRTVTAVARNASQAVVAAPSLTWTSSAPTVATVVGTGTTATVTAVGNGTATISAASGSVQGTVQVTVEQRMTSVSLNGAPTSLSPGGTAQLSAEARDGRQRAVAGVTGFTFASSNASVAIVSPTGLVTAIAPGTANITSAVTKDGVTANGTAPISVAFASSNPTSATVNATDLSLFTPSTVTIAPGGNVTWTFAEVAHNVTFRTTGAPANIGNSASTSVSRTFPTVGTFAYDCTLHAGMNGTVVVQGSATGAGFTALLNGANERPNPVTTDGAGAAAFTVNGATVSYVVTFSRLTATPIGAHIHGPGSAAQAVGVLVDFPTAGQTSNAGVLSGTFTAANIRGQGGQPPISLDSLLTLMRTSNAYVNVHTPQFPGGEIRGQIRVP